MAEGDSAQNQGQQQQPEPPKEVKNEVEDPKKLEKAAKERERRRRRRRKKAELRRLEREASEHQNGSAQDIQSTESKSEPKPEEKTDAPEEKVPEPQTQSFTGPLMSVPEEPTPEVQPEPLPPELPQENLQPETTVEPEPVLQPEPPMQPESAVQPEPFLQPEAPPSELPPLWSEDQPHWAQKGPEPVQDDAPPLPPVSEPEWSSQRSPQPFDQPEPEPPSPSEPQYTSEPQAPQAYERDMVPTDQPEELHDLVDQPVHYAGEVNYNQEQEAETAEEVVPESEGLNQKKSASQGAGAFSAGALQSLKTKLHHFRLKFDFRRLRIFIILMVVGAVLYGGYIFKVHEKVYNLVAGIFHGKSVVEEPVTAQIPGETGISPALIFGDNRGSVQDLIAVQLANSFYFGLLSEPHAEGETGITPAYFFGTLADLNAESNRFIGYVTNLRELMSSYDVNIYQMLNQTTEREQTLTAHISKLKDIQSKSTEVMKELNAEIDDTKIAFDSLNPDRTRFETDFFAAVQGLAGTKADYLLKSFIDIAQKQVALKAHLAALQQLLGYYDSALKNLTIRITGIEKNFQVLAQGIRVIDIPGANLDIILKQNP